MAMASDATSSAKAPDVILYNTGAPANIKSGGTVDGVEFQRRQEDRAVRLLWRHVRRQNRQPSIR